MTQNSKGLFCCLLPQTPNSPTKKQCYQALINPFTYPNTYSPTSDTNGGLLSLF